jgi:hypothetical protein
MSAAYERGAVAALLEAHGAPEREVDVWLSGALKPTDSLAAFRAMGAALLLKPAERESYMGLMGGSTGAGKTVGAVAMLAEAMLEARHRKALGAAVRGAWREEAEVITPERVRRVLGLDWESYLANEKLQPEVCAAQVREAYTEEQGWSWEQAPLSFAFWDCSAEVSADTWSEAFHKRKEWARTCEVLVLDDLPDRFPENGPWVGTVVELVNARYSARLVTLLTTNADKPTFLRRYGPRVADRVRHAGFARWTPEKSLRGTP